MSERPHVTLGVIGDVRKPQHLTLHVGGYYYAGIRGTATIRRNHYAIAPYEVTIHPQGDPHLILGFYHVNGVVRRAL